MSRVLIDTNAYTAFLAGDQDVLVALSASSTVFLSTIVLGELQAGFVGGQRRQHNLALLTTFMKRPTVQVLDVTVETAEIFGFIKQSLKQAGTPIPMNFGPTGQA